MASTQAPCLSGEADATGVPMQGIKKRGRELKVFAQRKAKRLITDGPFALCRNPIYRANMAGMAGFVVLCETLWYLPLYLVFVLVFYDLIVRYEEYLLESKFGAPYRFSSVG